jgi:hypothetical protein
VVRLVGPIVLTALRQGRGVVALLERRLEAVFTPLKRAIVVNEIKWCTVDLATRALSCVLVALFAWRAECSRRLGAASFCWTNPPLTSTGRPKYRSTIPCSNISTMPASSRQFIGLQLLDRFDEVLLMKAGRLVAQGPVAQLAAHSRDFQELVGIAEFIQAAVSVAA